MQTKKRFKWTGKFSDQCAGKYLWWSSGAWTLSYDGVRISRHDSSEQAKRKDAKHQKTKNEMSAKAQTIHDSAASVVRHIELDALEYERARDADLDPRDDEDPEIEDLILMASETLAEECARTGVTSSLIAR